MLTHTRSVFGTVVILVILFSSVTYTACKKTPYTYVDKCSNVDCKNGATCADGKCYCTTGYTGEHCEKKAIIPYLGKWDVTQQIVGSNNTGTVGNTKTYKITITEGSTGITFLNIDGFLGDTTFNNVSARIATMIGYTMVDSVNVETDVPASPSSFTFKRYQPLGKSYIQLLKGEGKINGLGTQITGEFYLLYPDSAKGAIEDRITFTATYIN